MDNALIHIGFFKGLAQDLADQLNQLQSNGQNDNGNHQLKAEPE